MVLLLIRCQVQRAHSATFHGKVVVESVLLIGEQLDSVGLDVLFHVVTLNKSPENTQRVKTLADRRRRLKKGFVRKDGLPFTVRALVRLVPTVDLPVPV